MFNSGFSIIIVDDICQIIYGNESGHTDVFIRKMRQVIWSSYLVVRGGVGLENVVGNYKLIISECSCDI